MGRVSSIGSYLEKFGCHEFCGDQRGRWVTSKGRRPLLSLLTATAISLVAAPRLSHALPIDEALTIQPIIVCDSSSGACATPDLATMQTVLNLVWAQAGIAPVLLPSETIVPVNDGGRGATQVGLTTGTDSTIPVDGFRLLTRTQNNGQSPNPNTINLYLNDTLSPFVNSRPQSGTVVRGTSFINGNGITISGNAVLDTVAHELGHVLGLDHATPDNNPIDPNNLMTGQPQGTRNIPTNMSQIGVPGGTDQLSQVQIDRARQPLFTVGLGRVTSTPFSNESCSVTDTCFEIAFDANPSVTETLNSVVFKYAPGTLVTGCDPIFDPASAFTTCSPAPGGIDCPLPIGRLWPRGYLRFRYELRRLWGTTTGSYLRNLQLHRRVLLASGLRFSHRR